MIVDQAAINAGFDVRKLEEAGIERSVVQPSLKLICATHLGVRCHRLSLKPERALQFQKASYKQLNQSISISSQHP
jgi:hypothetical protein